MLNGGALAKAPGGSEIDSTTLVTFLLQGLREVNHIELFGSWDNFSAAYPMSRDSKRGRGYWRGIHTFKNIICDGDLSATCGRRDGALRTGGLYWYFYRLNGVHEYHNPVEPSTNNCPLLPGQTVNILEVPRELLVASPSNGLDFDPSSVMTLNPEVRWAPLKKRKKRNFQLSDLPKRSISEVVRKRIEGAAQRLHSAHSVAAERVLDDISRLLTGDEDKNCRSSRPKSCPAAVQIPISRPHAHKKVHKPRANFGLQLQSCGEVTSAAPWSPLSDQSTRPESCANPFARIRRYTSVRSHNVQDILRRGRDLPSRARTAIALSVPTVDPFDVSEETTAPSNDGKSEARPVSAPSTFASPVSPVDANELSDSARLTHRMRSLRLRIACAKLRKLQTDHEKLQSDTSWILDSLPDTYSGILNNFESSEGLKQQQKSFKHASATSEELSQSPPQLSFSSRGSILWTPDTASLFGTSEGAKGSLFRTSIHDSLDFEIAVQEEEEEEMQEQRVLDPGKGVDRLSVRFSGLGRDSQETIKPPHSHTVTPLDPSWNPFTDATGSTNTVQASDERSKQDGITSHSKKLSNNELMKDLGFLGDAIV